MSLLQEIQLKAVDSKTDISDLLRLCLILAEKLDHKPLKKWVEMELNGYLENSELPDYRIFKNGKVYGDLVGINATISKTLIPLSIIHEQFRAQVSDNYLRDGVKQLVSLLEKGPDAQLVKLWPADALSIVDVNRYFREDFVLTRAWTAIEVGSIVGALDTIRNRVLKFALEVEKSNPKAGEAQFGSQPVSEKKMTQIFNTTINGPVTNMASGSDFTQVVGSLPNLREYLKELGLESEEIEALETAIRDDKKSDPKKPGTKAKKWLSAMAEKVFEKAIPVSLDTIQKAILHYYNL